MVELQKTTIYLPAAEYRRLKALAREQDRPTAELIREAVAEYVRRHGSLRRPTSVGAGKSGVGDISERAEELLSDFGRPG